MKPHIFQSSIELPVSAAEAFAWHERPGAFERLAPPWQHTEVLRREGGLRDGDRVVLRIGFGPLRFRWVVEHRDYEPGRAFTDVQLEGPFAAWEHRHLFLAETDTRCILWDEIDWLPPLGRLGDRLGGPTIARALRQAFRFRHRVTAHDLALHARFADQPRKRVAISGASGFLGAALAHLLTTGGHEVLRLVRRPARGDDEVAWDPREGVRDPARLEGIDAAVHLAGESVAGLWTAAKRRRLRESRVLGTRVLSESLAALSSPPEVLVSASAVGIYGDRGPNPLTEDRPPGQGFLAQLCVDWERAGDPARAAGIRVVHPRLGVVLDPRGGLLRATLPAARLGLGAVVGSGAQFVSWVSLDDAISALYFALMSPSMEGPVNVAAPRAVTQRAFTRALADLLGRPAPLRFPARLARAALGQMADETLLASARAVPDRLLEAGYPLRDPELEQALRFMLGLMTAEPPDAEALARRRAARELTPVGRG